MKFGTEKYNPELRVLRTRHQEIFLKLPIIRSPHSADQSLQQTSHRHTVKTTVHLLCTQKALAMAAEPGPLYEDTFSITSLNSEKYDRVARVTGTNANGDSYMSLDINSQLYPLATGDQVYILLSSTLSSDGTKDDGKAWREVSRGGSTLADHYEYVCHGKIYRFEDGENDNM